MVKDFGDAAVKLARNPLGIIALAFVLVYGITAVVATSTIFQANERLMLVYFLIAFPILILIVFFVLVTRHHAKLYAPSDFKQDESFLCLIDAHISNSPKFLELEQVTGQIKKEIDNQPLYRYTRLSECGKQLILGLNKQNQFQIPEYTQKRDFTAEEVKQQADLLVKFGWASRQGDELSLTPKGRSELETFVDLVYGRIK